MTSPSGDDSAIFAVTPSGLLDQIRIVSAGGAAREPEARLLVRAGLIVGTELADAGLALFKLAWVLRNRAEAERALAQALRVLTPLQVIEQELRGLGPVPEEGVLDLLKQHRAVSDDVAVADIRKVMRWLNTNDIVVYSQKLKTVRSLAPAPDAPLAGEIRAIAGMVSPKTPYLNVVRLRRVLRSLEGVVWWADAHFSARALEELAEELDPSRVTEVRIVSGDAESVLTSRSLSDFKRFQAEMLGRGLAAEWRVDSRKTRDWHDRWIADDKGAWNVPPVNTLLKNDYSEIVPVTERPPFEDWWTRGASRV